MTVFFFFYSIIGYEKNELEFILYTYVEFCFDKKK